jgi:hypothetical protein
MTAGRSTSAAILLYLCERHPEAKLMPLPGSPERGLFLQWLFFFTNTVQEEMMHWWHADNYMDSEAGRAEKLKRIAERRLAQACMRKSARPWPIPDPTCWARPSAPSLPGHALPLDPQDGEAGDRLAGAEAAGGSSSRPPRLATHDEGRGHHLDRRYRGMNRGSLKGFSPIDQYNSGHSPLIMRMRQFLWVRPSRCGTG